jgi:DNA-binding response OmpR family regulator
MMVERILVIDNNESIRQFLSLSLNDEGYQTFSYDYAHIDRATLEELNLDLIILDFNSRDNGIGWELLQMLKMDDATARIPILILTTAFHLSREVQDYLLTRYISVVYKPFDLDAFLTLVQKTLTQANQAGAIFSSDRSLPILVVEDSEDLRETLTTILSLEGYPVASAENGLVALDTVSRAEHCLILLDIAMPLMDGFEFLKAYDQQLRPHSPIIILSGEEDILTRDLPSFVIDVLRKPFEIKDMLSFVKKFAQPV